MIVEGLKDKHQSEVTREDIARVSRLTEFDGGKHILLEHRSLQNLVQIPAFHAAAVDEWDLGPYIESKEALDRATSKALVPTQVFDEYKVIRSALEPAIEKVAGNAATTRRRRIYSEDGEDLDIVRYVGGLDECWETRVRGRKKRLVRIGVCLNNNSHSGTDVYTRTGALAGAAAELLHRVGFAVEVVGLCSSTHHYRDGHTVTNAITLKHANEKVDHSKILISALQGLTRVYAYTAANAVNFHPGQTHATKPCQEVRDHLKINAIINHADNIEKSGTDSVFHDADLEGFFSRASEILKGVTTKRSNNR